jgi:SulP family sulfate permease
MDFSTNGYSKLARLATHDERAFLKELDYGKSRRIKKSQIQKMQENWRSGITVGLVNLPLCISLAVAGGSTPEVGILSGIWSGIASGIWGGSNYNIVGPTGALSGFLAVCASRYEPGSLALIAVFTAIFTFLVKLYEIEKYIDLFPVPVNEGFTLGVAFIIFFSQINSFLGIGKIPKKEGEDAEENLVRKIVNNLIHIDQMKPLVFITYLIFFIGLLQAIKWRPKIPWMIIISAIGICIGYLFPSYPTLFTVFGEPNFTLFVKPDFDPVHIIDPRFYADCIPVAFIAILETLISAKIADSLTNTKFHKQRELRGLALANLFCGAAGGLPVTAALARTALNIRVGATHKYSSVFSSLTMILLAGVFFKYFKFLPLCIVSCQVCVVAVRMVNIEELKHLYHYDTKNFIVLILSAVISIIHDPSAGIVFGMLVYYLLFAEQLILPWNELIVTKESIIGEKRVFSEEDCHFLDIPKENNNFVVYRIVGVINFINIEEHKEKILALANKSDCVLIISLRYMYLCDLDAVTALKTFIDELLKKFKKDKSLYITGLSRSKLEKMPDREWLKNLKDKNVLLYDDFIDVEAHH